MRTLTRRRFLRFAVAGPLAGLVGCQNWAPCIFGYKMGAGALYDPNIETVYVPVFNNRAFQTTPYRGFEVDVTQAVVREIGAKTPYRVVSDPGRADTELLGNIVLIQKNILNRTQQNTVRDGEVVVSVDVVWRDLRDGTILSAPRKPRPPGPGLQPGDPVPVPFDPSVPLPPAPCEVPQVVPARIVAGGRYVQELGETNASASKRAADQIAVQIVSMMERKW
jgi:Lipopolysaccharide-assembly